MKLTRAERSAIARKRLIRVLTKHGIATARTLEQKISDAGPTPQRIDPHILTEVRKEMVREGRIKRVQRAQEPWFYLPETPGKTIEARLKLQEDVLKPLHKRDVVLRLGQTLEIATYRALCDTDMTFFGRFKDLDDHDDSTLYKKEEPPSHIGKKALKGDEKLDFIVNMPGARLGIECKNVRQWLYTDREEVRETLRKCLALDLVPVIIARRIPFVTFKLLSTCGVILHQVYNQLLPAADAVLADKARHKDLLGYHDIRTGNVPDARLKKFIGTNLLSVAEESREKFDEYEDLLSDFASDVIDYSEFAARVRRRTAGTNEDHDWEG